MITLVRRYWNDLVSYDGGLALLMMDARVSPLELRNVIFGWGISQ